MNSSLVSVINLQQLLLKTRKHKELRGRIVDTVLSFCHANNIEYRAAWKLIYEEYGNRYHIWPAVMYKFGHRNKLDFLADYEDLYRTLTKLNNLVTELKS